MTIAKFLALSTLIHTFLLASNPASATDISVGFDPKTRIVSLNGIVKPDFSLGSTDIANLFLTLKEETVSTPRTPNHVVPLEKPMTLKLLSTQTIFEITGFVCGSFVITDSKNKTGQILQEFLDPEEITSKLITNRDKRHSLAFWSLKTHLLHEIHYYLLIPLNNRDHKGTVTSFPSTTAPDKAIRLCPKDESSANIITATMIKSYNTTDSFYGTESLLLCLRLVDIGTSTEIPQPLEKQYQDLLDRAQKLKKKT